MTDTIKPAAWIHAVTNGEDEDYALSFAPDNFPLNGIAGFKSVDVQPLFTKAALDAAVAQERERIGSLLVAIREHWVKANGEDSMSVGALDRIAEVIADGSYVARAALGEKL